MEGQEKLQRPEYWSMGNVASETFVEESLSEWLKESELVSFTPDRK